MATPVITNNSPILGSIAWTTFTIQYNGVGYVVSAGNTSQRWVWWRYNAGSSVIEAGATIPTDLTADDLVLFRNKVGIGTIIQKPAILDGEMLVPLSVLTAALADGAVTTAKIAAGGIGPFKWDSSIRPAFHGEYNTSTGTNVTTSTWQKRTGWAEVSASSPLGGITFASNSWTITQKGIYLISASIALAAAATASRKSRLIKNTAATPVTLSEYDSPTGTTALKLSSLPVSYQGFLDVGDIVEIQAWHDTGVNVAFSTLPELNTFSIFCLGTLP